MSENALHSGLAGSGRSALVLFSGGQDSTVCLAWALQTFDRVETVGFDYRQRHRIELDCRDRLRERIGGVLPDMGDRLGPDHLLDLGVLGEIADTALTRDRAIELAETGLPTSFVPGRNLVFLSLAGAVAYRRGIDVLVGGMCETDYSGYPDCRRSTLDAMADALRLGLDRPMAVETPLMLLDKAATWRMAEALGGPMLVDLIIEDTHTCYLGDRSLRHDWGYGCGECPACRLRATGWEGYRANGADGTARA